MTAREIIARSVVEAGGTTILLAAVIAVLAAVSCVDVIVDAHFLTVCIEKGHTPHDCRVALIEDLEVPTRMTPLEVAP